MKVKKKYVEGRKGHIAHSHFKQSTFNFRGSKVFGQLTENKLQFVPLLLLQFNSIYLYCGYLRQVILFRNPEKTPELLPKANRVRK